MRLMKLSIPSSFAVTFNKFYDISPIIEKEEDLIDNWEYFTEDLLQISKLSIKSGKFYIPDEYFLVDLGWYPDSDPRGKYGLKLVKVAKNVWKEIKEFDSINRYEIAQKIEEWLDELNN